MKESALRALLVLVFFLLGVVQICKMTGTKSLERYSPIPVPFLPASSILHHTPLEPDVHVCARAKHPSMARQDDAFDAIIDVEQLVCCEELLHHSPGEGIVVLRSVELQHNNRSHRCRRRRDV